MNPTEIEFAVRALVAELYNPDTFPFSLIGIYNAPKVTVTKLKSGQTNFATAPGDVLWKKKMFFRNAGPTVDVAIVADALANDPLTARHSPRFIVVTNGAHVHIRDRQLDDTCNIDFDRLDESSDFLLPMAGFERRDAVVENPADVKAAKRLAKLYDAVLAANPIWGDGNHTHELNLFMTRILFCFYAEDTGIFETHNLFTDTVTQHTSEDGLDMSPLLARVFAVMNVKDEDRAKSLSKVDTRFPYVNGSLFEASLPIPKFNRTCRRLFIECGELDWQTINPDIFGSMIQTIAQPGSRGDLGMHYTSVPNIMKVLSPLFLDAINDEYEKAQDSVQNLEAILVRLSKIRVFDPACGSGNFLIVAYKELRQIEMRVLSRIGEIAPNNPLRLSGIVLNNFFGIDVVDFACETAKLSLWIAEYQMNSAFKAVFGSARPPLPLGKISTIHCQNSLRVNWADICPANDNAETYICGNPPYVGRKKQTRNQKDDIVEVFNRVATNFGHIDYVGCFFLKATEYMVLTPSRASFVSTNSICQGEQVPIIWPLIFERGVEITYAYPSFKWQNNASHNAGVTCVIIGLARRDSSKRKSVYTENHRQEVSTIGPYLIPGSSIVVQKSSQPINSLPPMLSGTQPTDDGNLLLSPSEMRALKSRFPEAENILRRYVGGDDLINGIERYCLWISDDNLELALSIPEVRKRIEAVKRMRQSSTDASTRRFALKPHKFQKSHHAEKASLILPIRSSERRQYLQADLLNSSDIPSNTLCVVYSPPPFLFALLSSRLHRIWTQTVGGKLEERLTYSNSLVYNTFPISDLSSEQKRILSEHSKSILRARARYPGKTIAWLYNPETMPDILLEAHQANDEFLEKQIYGRNFKDDNHRLEHLFTMYAGMTMRERTPLLEPIMGKNPKKVQA